MKISKNEHGDVVISLIDTMDKGAMYSICTGNTLDGMKYGQRMQDNAQKIATFLEECD